MNLRLAALHILCRQAESGKPIDSIMKQQLSKTVPDERDSHLIMALVYGVLRQRRYLDGLISTFAKHPLKKMKPRTLQALRLGVYQLLFMERIPAPAAINETVQALKDLKQPKWLINFVNGVLRNMDRNQDRMKNAPKKMSAAQRVSHPDWLFKRWSKRYGEERTLALCRTNNSPPILTLRMNSNKISLPDFLDRLDAADIKGIQGKKAPEAIILPGYKGKISALPGFKQGFFHVQDEAAQLIVSLFEPFKSGHYLDCCAGLGGKAVQLAGSLSKESLVTAIEPNKSRLGKLKENLDRMGVGDRVSIFPGTAQDFAQKGSSSFNFILVDAPCSGLGVIRRHPDIRWNRTENDLYKYQTTQIELLQTAVSLLAPGGVLIYATCSIEPEETDGVIRQLLETHPEIGVEQPQQSVAADFLDEHGFLRTLPDEDHDGFFAAKLRKG